MTFNAIYYDISSRTVHLTELIQIRFEAGVVAMTSFWSIYICRLSSCDLISAHISL